MNIGLIDVDGKQPNIALMKLSRWPVRPLNMLRDALRNLQTLQL